MVLEGIPPIHLAQGHGGREDAGRVTTIFPRLDLQGRPSWGWDPAERLKDMDIDGVAAEVIYTTLGFRQFWLTDAALQRASSGSTMTGWPSTVLMPPSGWLVWP